MSQSIKKGIPEEIVLAIKDINEIFEDNWHSEHAEELLGFKEVDEWI